GVQTCALPISRSRYRVRATPLQKIKAPTSTPKETTARSSERLRRWREFRRRSTETSTQTRKTRYSHFGSEQKMIFRNIAIGKLRNVHKSAPLTRFNNACDGKR